MKEWSSINRGDKTALGIPVPITNIWTMELRLNVLSRNLNKAKNRLPPGGVRWLILVGYVPLASQSPYPIIVYFVANYIPHLSHFWANM